MAKTTNKNTKTKQVLKPEAEKPKVKEAPVESIEPVIGKAIIKCNKRLNLRAGKSKNAEVLMVLEPNTILTVTDFDPEAEWTKVIAVADDAFGDEAYVMTEFIEVM